MPTEKGNDMTVPKSLKFKIVVISSAEPTLDILSRYKVKQADGRWATIWTYHNGYPLKFDTLERAESYAEILAEPVNEFLQVFVIAA